MPEGAFARRYMFYLSVNPKWYLWGGKAPNIEDEASQRWMALVRQACNKGLYKIEYDMLEMLWVEARAACEEARKKTTTPTAKGHYPGSTQFSATPCRPRCIIGRFSN